MEGSNLHEAIWLLLPLHLLERIRVRANTIKQLFESPHITITCLLRTKMTTHHRMNEHAWKRDGLLSVLSSEIQILLQ